MEAVDATPSPPIVATPGRAARGACAARRCRLFAAAGQRSARVSRRTIGRMAEAI